MTKRMTWILILVLVISSVLAYAEDFDIVEEGTGEIVERVNVYDELVVGQTTPLSGNFLSSIFGNNSSDADIWELLHGYSLVIWDSETGGFVVDPMVVTGSVVTQDKAGNRRYLIALSENLTYSDGTPITVRDYAFAMLFSMAPEITQLGGTSSQPVWILGYEDYTQGKTDVLEGVRIMSDYLMEITISSEYVPFFYELGLLDYYPMPVHVIAPECTVEDDGDGAYINRYVDGKDMFTVDILRETLMNPLNGYKTHPTISSGPYVLVSFDEQEQKAVFEINELYKGNSDGILPIIPRLIWMYVRNESMIEQLNSDQVGLLNRVVNSSTIMNGIMIMAGGNYSMSAYTRSGLSYVAFCCESPKVSSEKVRQAIYYCMDKEQLVTDYVGNYGMLSNGYYGMGQWMYQMVNHTLTLPIVAPEEDASDEEVEEYETKQQIYDSLSFDNLQTYDMNLEAAEALLIEDGWILNSKGEKFVKGADKVRAKMVDDQLITLDMSFVFPEGNTIAESMQKNFVDNLMEVGIQLRLEPKPMNDLLAIYYRDEERSCDMIYLASNFTEVFDPAVMFDPLDAKKGNNNFTGIEDQELYDLAVRMRSTEPGNVLEYVQRWLAFQERFTEVLPLMPLYTNVYFDFYTSKLVDYAISSSTSWTTAIVPAYLSDADLTTSEDVDEDEFIDTEDEDNIEEFFDDEFEIFDDDGYESFDDDEYEFFDDELETFDDDDFFIFD